MTEADPSQLPIQVSSIVVNVIIGGLQLWFIAPTQFSCPGLTAPGV